MQLLAFISAPLDWCYGNSFPLFLDATFEEENGEKPYANGDFKTLLLRRSQMVAGCYLNISGRVLKGFKDAL